MGYESYLFDNNTVGSLYWFLSRTPDGKNPVVKTVRFQRMYIPERFNLALASVIDGKADYHHESRNQDLNKILGTVAEIVKDFINKNPRVEVYVTGNTPVKTRLYQMQIAGKLSEIEKLYNVYGAKAKGGAFTAFTKDEAYFAFLISKK